VLNDRITFRDELLLRFFWRWLEQGVLILMNLLLTIICFAAESNRFLFVPFCKATVIITDDQITGRARATARRDDEYWND